jgi:hypothetical protein
MKSWGWTTAIRLSGAAMAGTLALAGPAVANVFADSAGGDPRVAAPRAALPPVGVMAVVDPATRKVTRSGTGFLVGPCLVMTAGHAAAPQLKAGAPLHFLVGPGETPYRVELVADGGGGGGTSGDWALLRAPDCPGAKAGIGWMGVDPRPFLEVLGRRVAAASFPFDRGTGTLSYEKSCAIRLGDPLRRVMAADCSATGGASGAPLFWLDGSGRPVAVALISAVATPTPGVLPAWDQAHATIALSLAEALSRTPAARDALLEDWKSGPNPLAAAGVGVEAPVQPPRGGR